MTLPCSTPSSSASKKPIQKKLRHDDAQLSKSILGHSSLYDAPFATPVCHSPNLLDDVHTDFDFARVHSSPAPSIPEEPFHGKVSLSMTDQWSAEKTTIAADMILHHDDHDLIQIQNISSLPPIVCIPSLIKWITGESSPKAWVLAYRSLLNCLREPQAANALVSPTAQSKNTGTPVPADHEQSNYLDSFVPLISQLIPAFQRDFSHDCQDPVIHEALKLFGFILYTPKLFSQLTVNHVVDLIQRALRVGLNTTDKTTCHLTIWILRMQRLPTTYLLPRPLLDSISLAIGFALKSPTPFDSTVIPTEAILVLETLLKLLPRHILSRASDWLQAAFWSMTSGNSLLRKHAIDLFMRHLSLLTSELSRLQQVLDSTWDRNNMRIVYELTELVGRNERDGMKMWSVSMVLWCVQMQRQGSMINGMLKVVERQFNIKRASAKLYGYRAWSYLILGSAITNSLSNERRLKLLMIPIINSQQHDRFVRLRCSSAETWMNLVYAIGCTVPTWSGNSFSIVIAPVLRSLLSADEAEIRAYGWTVFDSLLNVANIEPNPGSLDTQIKQLEPILNHETNPSEYLRTMQISGKWFREKVEDLLVILRTAYTAGPRQDELNDLAISPEMNVPVMTSRVHSTFRKILIALERVCQKDIYLNQDTINALIHVGGFLSSVVLPRDSSEVDINGAYMIGCVAHTLGEKSNQEHIWLAMDTLDLLVSTLVAHLSRRLLQNSRCRFKDLEETCRMRLATGSIHSELFNVAEIAITPATHVVLLWIKAFVSDLSDNAQKDASFDSILGNCVSSFGIGDESKAPMPELNVLTQGDGRRWDVYWQRYTELAELAADSKNLVQAMFSTLALIEVQASMYPPNAQLKYWVPLAEHVITYLSTSAFSAATLNSRDSMSDIDMPVDERDVDDMVPTLLLWPLSKLAKLTNDAIEFPLEQWVTLFNLVIDTRQSIACRKLPHVVSQTLCELFNSESVNHIHEATLNVLVGVTHCLLARFTANVVSSVRLPIKPEDATMRWTRHCIDRLSGFMARSAMDADVEIPLWPACSILLSVVSESIQSVYDSQSVSKGKTLVRLFEEWCDPIMTIVHPDALLCLTPALTEQGKNSLNQLVTSVVGKMITVWSEPGNTGLTAHQIFDRSRHMFAVALSSTSPDLVELTCRVWNRRFGEIVNSPLFIEGISEDFSQVLARLPLNRNITILVPLIIDQRHESGQGVSTGNDCHAQDAHGAEAANPSNLIEATGPEEKLGSPSVPGSSPRQRRGRKRRVGSSIVSGTETDSDYTEDDCTVAAIRARKNSARAAHLKSKTSSPLLMHVRSTIKKRRQQKAPSLPPTSPCRSSPTPHHSTTKRKSASKRADVISPQYSAEYRPVHVSTPETPPSHVTGNHGIGGQIERGEEQTAIDLMHLTPGARVDSVILDNVPRNDLAACEMEAVHCSNENVLLRTPDKDTGAALPLRSNKPVVWLFDAQQATLELIGDQLKGCSLTELVALQHQLLAWTSDVNQEVAKQLTEHTQRP